MEIGKGWPNTYPTIHSFIQFDSTLYAATYENGLWKRGIHDSAWTETTRPLDEELQIRDKMPRGMAVHHDSLWVGYMAGPVFQTKDGVFWSAKRNCMTTNGCFDAPYSAFALLSYRDRLFAAGQGSASPVEWTPTPANGFPSSTRPGAAPSTASPNAEATTHGTSPPLATPSTPAATPAS